LLTPVQYRHLLLAFAQPQVVAPAYANSHREDESSLQMHSTHSFAARHVALPCQLASVLVPHHTAGLPRTKPLLHTPRLFACCWPHHLLQQRHGRSVAASAHGSSHKVFNFSLWKGCCTGRRQAYPWPVTSGGPHPCRQLAHPNIITRDWAVQHLGNAPTSPSSPLTPPRTQGTAQSVCIQHVLLGVSVCAASMCCSGVSILHTAHASHGRQ
jgi:hypothetical protein